MTEYLIILCYVEASQVITVNENLPLSPVEPETVTERRTVKMCCCIPKGDVLLNSWYVFGFLMDFWIPSQKLSCFLVQETE